MNIEELERHYHDISYDGGCAHVYALCTEMLAALKEQVEEIASFKIIANASGKLHSEQLQEVTALMQENARLREALKKLVNKIYGTVEFDAAITDAMEVLDPP